MSNCLILSLYIAAFLSLVSALPVAESNPKVPSNAAPACMPVFNAITTTPVLPASSTPDSTPSPETIPEPVDSGPVISPTCACAPTGSVYTKTITYANEKKMTLSSVLVPTSTVHTVAWDGGDVNWADGIKPEKRHWLNLHGSHYDPTVAVSIPDVSVSVPAVSVPIISAGAISVGPFSGPSPSIAVGVTTTSGTLVGVYTMPASCMANSTSSVVPTSEQTEVSTSADTVNLVDTLPVTVGPVKALQWYGPVGPV